MKVTYKHKISGKILSDEVTLINHSGKYYEVNRAEAQSTSPLKVYFSEVISKHFKSFTL
jgi:hypothetical protein